MAQVVKCLSSKSEALVSNPSTTKKIKKERKKERRISVAKHPFFYGNW
jgi:hypothetical protein